MEDLRISLAAALRQLPPAAEGAAALLAWGLVAGPQLAAHAPAEQLDNGVLRLRVADAAWRREIEALRPELLRALAAVLGPGRIAGLSFGPPRAPAAGPGRPPAATIAPVPSISSRSAWL